MSLPRSPGSVRRSRVRRRPRRARRGADASTGSDAVTLDGATTEHATAVRNAQRWAQLDPHKVKHWRNVWASENVGSILSGPRTRHFVVDQEPEFFSLEEQEYLASRVFWDVPKESWLYAESPGEGMLPRRLTTISTRRLDRGMYVDEKLVPVLRQRLMARDGVVVDDAHATLQRTAADPEPLLQDGAKARQSITRRSPRGAA